MLEMTAPGHDLHHPAGGAPADPAGYGRGESGRVADGVWVVFWVQRDGDTVADCRYEVYGPPSAIALAAWYAARVMGQRPDAVDDPGPDAALAALDLPPERGGEALLVAEALHRALDCEEPGGTPR